MMMRATLSTVLIALAAIASSAYAEPGVEQRWAPPSPHANTGFEILGGPDAWSFALRTHVGVDAALGLGRVRPSIGIGGTLALGSLDVEDPRALSGTVSIGYYEIGPEVRLGLRWVDGGIVDTQLFASFAYLRTTLDERLMLDAVDGVGGTRGMRAALGLNWAQQSGRAAADSRKGHELDWTVLLLPQQAEISWERSCGSDRVGVTFSYGL